MADSLGHLVFACAQRLYGVPAERAYEVVTLPALTWVPGAPAHLLGVFAHRGELIPAIDLAMLTGTKLDGVVKRAVLVRVADRAVAITVTRVAGVFVLEVPENLLVPLGVDGIEAHLRGPVTVPVGQVAIIESKGFFEFLSHHR